jgi:hypothetical protein
MAASQSSVEDQMQDPKAKPWLSLVASFVLIALALFLAAGTIR